MEQGLMTIPLSGVLFIVISLTGAGLILWLITGGSKPKLDPSRVIKVLYLLKHTYSEYLKQTKPDCINTGLCGILRGMVLSGTISNYEHSEIKDILKINKPESQKYSPYWWHILDSNSRIEFLDTLIKKYEEAANNVRSNS